MAGSRIAAAIDDNGLVLPQDGQIAVFRPKSENDYSALPQNRLIACQSFKPEYDWFVRSTIATQATYDGPFSACLVDLTRSKDESLGLIAQAFDQVAAGGLIIVDGAKKSGADSVLNLCKKLLTVAGTVSKSHGKLFWMIRPPDISGTLIGWHEKLAPRQQAHGFIAGPGMFSPAKIDMGSQLLAGCFAGQLSGVVADLGAGWGFLSAQIMQQPNVTKIDLFEAEHSALAAARRNVTDPRAQFFWEDVATMTFADRYDHVVCNPPFHQSRAADPDLGRAFVKSAAGALKPRGNLWLVANRQLPYEAVLSECFSRVEVLEENRMFKAFLAQRPKDYTRNTKRPVRS